MQHFEEGTIHAWLDGALSADEGVDVARHVAQCAECASLVAEARGMIAGATRIVTSLDIVRAGVIPRPARRASVQGSLWRSMRLTPARAALAATVLIAVSTLLTVRHDTPDKIVPAPISTAPRLEAPSPPADAQTVAPAPARPPIDGAQRAAKAAKPSSPRRDVDDARGRVVVDSAREVSSMKASANEATARPIAKLAADSTQANRAAGATPGFAPRRLERAAALREAMVMIGGQRGGLFVGCYQLTPDLDLKFGSLPERFALEPWRADTNQNVVRVVAPDGRVESAIAGSYWVPMSAGLINVRFATGEKQQSLMIRFAAGNDTGVATVTGDGRPRTLSIGRIACRP